MRRAQRVTEFLCQSKVNDIYLVSESRPGMAHDKVGGFNVAVYKRMRVDKLNT
jgi:hypothetical protein